jgi:hypothetical protein
MVWQTVDEAIDQPGCKSIPCAHPIHDVGDFVMRAEQKILAIVQAGRPAVRIRVL